MKKKGKIGNFFRGVLFYGGWTLVILTVICGLVGSAGDFDWPNSLPMTLGISFAIPGLIMVIVESAWDNDIRARTWHTIAEGVFEGVEYSCSYESKRSGAIAHSYTTKEIAHTIVYFADGRTCILCNCRYTMTDPRGSYIVVQANGNEQYKIVATYPPRP